MGYPMAINLREKLPDSAKLVVADLNQQAIDRFVDQTKITGNVEIASNPREVGKVSVELLALVPAYWRD